MNIVNLDTECSDLAYRALIEFVSERSCLFYLVDQFGLLEEESPFLIQAKPFLQKQEVVREWPGTRLVGSRTVGAKMMYYVVNEASVRLLLETSTSLYEWSRWSNPPLPEDLGFIRQDTRVLLATISHENDAWMELEDVELTVFQTLAEKSGITILSIEPK